MTPLRIIIGLPFALGFCASMFIGAWGCWTAPACLIVVLLINKPEGGRVT